MFEKYYQQNSKGPYILGDRVRNILIDKMTDICNRLHTWTLWYIISLMMRSLFLH